MTKEQILNEVRALDPEDQEQLADAIWLAAQGVTREQIEAEWAEEIRRRLAAMDRGEGSSKPVEQVMQRLRDKTQQ
jgi:putative addiction module component (TIGR02574 family)